MNNLYTLSLDSIKYILGLIRDTVDLPANILDDLHIQSTTTYSSYRLDTLLKALKEENIQYCDEAISKLNKLSKEIITDKLQITNENTIYLLLTDPVNNVYEQWLLINGTPQMIGTTEMKLDSVYTKNEADDRYALLTDFNTLTTSFNNLVTSVEKKIDKDKIVTVLDNTVTDEQVPSARLVYEELDKKIEGDNVVKKDDIVAVLDNTVTDEQVPSGKAVVDELGLKANDDEVVKKTDIVTTIDKTSTDDTVPSTSAIYNKSKNKINEVLSGGDITTYADGITSETVTDTVRIMNGTNSPYGTDNTDNDFHYTIYNIADDRFKRIVAYDVRKNDMYMIMKNAGTWGEWQRVFTTTVADVSETKYSLDTNCDGVYELGDKGTNNCWYAIRNGWCVVQFDLRCLQTMAGYKRVFTSLPKPIATIANVFMSNDIVINEGDKPLIVIVEGDGMMKAEGGKLYGRYIGTFSYPVAE